MLATVSPDNRERVLAELVKNDKPDISSITDRKILETEMQLYERVNYNYGRVAEVALKLGYTDKAEELFEKQIAGYENEKKYGEAGLTALKMGNKKEVV
jgi:hypothetical protein